MFPKKIFNISTFFTVNINFEFRILSFSLEIDGGEMNWNQYHR